LEDIMKPTLHVVIPAGGSGTRLWPLSRAAVPKFLHPLSPDGRSLLASTVQRLAPLSDPSRTVVITGVAHAVAVMQQCPQLMAENILVEPSPRDSCPAIGLAAAVIAARDPEAVMACFAADHLVEDVTGFHDVIRAAVERARAGSLVTVGITPTRPETGYGYLRCGDAIDGGPARAVLEFTEKPHAALAEEYVDSGDHLWNAGMFIWRAATFLDLLGDLEPEMRDGLRLIAAQWDGGDREGVLAEVWPTLRKTSIDYAVMEPAARAGLVSTVPGAFGWNDVGDFDTVGTVWQDEGKNATVRCQPGTGPQPLLYDSVGVVAVTQTGRLVATLGVNDMIVVDTPDVLLVCARSRAQEVRALVEDLRERGDIGYL
jgi:mannose-1-phosphate guanylyltransferase